MKQRHAPAGFPTSHHDHHACVVNALSLAEDYCDQQGLRLTELRRQVLELVWNSHRPVGAYDLLESITQNGRKAAPPTVYRSLDFLLDHNLIHRIDSMNAYIGCNQPGHRHDAVFFICNRCGEAAELADTRIEKVLEKDAQYLGFSIAKRTIEITGTCDECTKRPK